MINYISKILYILPKSWGKSIFYITILTLLNAVFELFGIGLVIPFLSVILGETNTIVNNIPFVKDLEKDLGLGDGSINSFKDFADAKRDLERQMGGGGGGPQGITLAGIQAPFDDPGTDPGAGADDPLSTYNSFTEAEKNTVDQIMDLGYDMSYGVNYIVGGGPVFSYGGGAYSGNF